jgi:hypothetical protein
LESAGYGLDEGHLPSAEELFGPGRTASPQEVRDSMMASMGLGPNPVPGPTGLPDVHGLAEDLGLA